MAAPAEPTEPIDFAALHSLATMTFHMSWLALVEIRAFKAGVNFETWVAGLPRSATGLAIGEFWVDATNNKLIYVTENNRCIDGVHA